MNPLVHPRPHASFKNALSDQGFHRAKLGPTASTTAKSLKMKAVENHSRRLPSSDKSSMDLFRPSLTDARGAGPRRLPHTIATL
ncbi:MAG: hypothetical protein ISP90_11120 [Nevskia sp.]|nr:hypothetical protein [Nevskia sp.]